MEDISFIECKLFLLLKAIHFSANDSFQWKPFSVVSQSHSFQGKPVFLQKSLLVVETIPFAFGRSHSTVRLLRWQIIHIFTFLSLSGFRGIVRTMSNIQDKVFLQRLLTAFSLQMFAWVLNMPVELFLYSIGNIKISAIIIKIFL